ncbi:hypothetical protein C463_09374 [Halorubrum californiense DSM 19288]|uniref:Uncharacterized protein n=1 Tax=Halorubrum californiense DSM 19288 TaxID=1227465 RepID=M0E7V4_9EURY|nr:MULTISPECIES: UPF0146 family protein [Halorubrum]ELZ43865.1 hypothetical protein C463_09374 [Halorubrum californiense DSM 19288]TKX69300.1 hypothetical protein EXE40_10850 [Halorubrum sp. GN11GM_10-3_MGM]
MGQPPPSERALVAALDRYERLIEVGIGRRPEVARALAERAREVVAVDVGVSEAARDAATETRASTAGSLRVVTADVTALATDDDRAMRDGLGLGASGEADSDALAVDAVYARNLPAELQRPTVALAERLDAACLFTTLGFEEPVVDVRRRSGESETVVYVAR